MNFVNECVAQVLKSIQIRAKSTQFLGHHFQSSLYPCFFTLSNSVKTCSCKLLACSKLVASKRVMR